MNCGCTTRPARPCPCQESLASFLGGFSFPISAGAIVVTLSIPGSDIVAPTNPTINDVDGLLAYLNTVVVGALTLGGHLVQGQFAVFNGTSLHLPTIDGACPVVFMRGRLLSDGPG